MLQRDSQILRDGRCAVYFGLADSCFMTFRAVSGDVFVLRRCDKISSSSSSSRPLSTSLSIAFLAGHNAHTHHVSKCLHSMSGVCYEERFLGHARSKHTDTIYKIGPDRHEDVRLPRLDGGVSASHDGLPAQRTFISCHVFWESAA